MRNFQAKESYSNPELYQLQMLDFRPSHCCELPHMRGG